jgi:hypothetical protein
MARMFDITAPTDRIALKASGRGEVTFTVTNTSGRKIRAGVKAVALEGATPDWLSIIGEAERDFDTLGSHQYVVQIAVPGAAAGRYPFRLDAYWVDDPNTGFDEGPTVVGELVTVEGRKQAVSPWLVALVTLALLVGVGLVAWYFVRGTGGSVEPVTGREPFAIDFETPQIEQSGEKAAAYTDPQSGVIFTTESSGGRVGLVRNAEASACVEPANRNQLLGTGSLDTDIGRGGFVILAELPSPRPRGTQVSVDVQSATGLTGLIMLVESKERMESLNKAASTDSAQRDRLLKEIIAGGNTSEIVQASGNCGLGGPTRGRQRVTVIAERPFSLVSISVPGSGARVGYVIDNFAIH